MTAIFLILINFLITSRYVLGTPVVTSSQATDSLLSGLNAIMSQCSTMNDTLQGFTIGPNIMPTALKVQFESDELLRDIIDAIAAAKQTPMLTKDDSVRVAIAVTKLQDVIYRLLDVLVAKKPVFDKAILGIGSASFLVSADLKSLKDATDGFGNEVVLRLANPIQQVAPLIISDLDFHFIRAIQVYSA